MAKDIYLFIGPPGSGKGSLSALCVDNLGWVQLSTGDLCRKHIAEKTSIGKEIDFAIKSGKLVSDELITAMVLDWFAGQEHSDNLTVILDGYPRTVNQAKAFHAALSEQLKGFKVHVIVLDVDDTIVANRISNRCVCQNKACQAVYSCGQESSCRSKVEMTCDKCSSPLIRRRDDTKEAVLDRLAVYHKHAQGLIDFYESKGVSIKRFKADVSLGDLFTTFHTYSEQSIV